MTHSPVVLVYVYACKHVLPPFPQDIWADNVLAIQAVTKATSHLPISTSTLPGPLDGCGTPSSSSSRGLIGASPLPTPR